MSSRRLTFLRFIHLFVAIAAIPAGLSMIFDTTGNGLGMSPELLVGSPFSTFLTPGIFLLVCLGISNLLFVFVTSRYEGFGGILMGVILVGWILIQIYWIGMTFFLQPLFLIVGLVQTALGIRQMTHQAAVHT